MGGPETDKMCDHLKGAISSGTQSLVMDFQNVQWINSTDVGVIISCLTTLRNRGGDIRFANLHSATKKYFEITKLEEVVRQFNSVDEAVGSLTGKGPES